MDRADIPASRKHCLFVAVLATVAAAGAEANPTGGDVTAGSANISESGSAVTIDQTSSRVAINWQTFNIGTGESVTFNQPSAQAIALNRILGQDPSLIQGTLTANGQIFLLNPNGVLFGAGAQVNVGGIVASTLGLSNEDFLAGRYTFTPAAGNSGSVLNEGTIQAADGGYVAFAGSNVTNAGVIRAHLGTVALGAGDQVTMNIDGGRLVGFNVDKSAVAALASNRQLIEADGGTVILSARAKDALLATVVNNDGVIEARSVTAHNGIIELAGGADGVVAVSGTLDASGVGSGETGGRVDVTGDKVALLGGAKVDVSGSAGGGSVRIGGGDHGENPDVQNASRTFVSSSATINADAVDSGDGGHVVVWADGDTQFHGSISARGGSTGGDGGFAEVSGKAQLGFDGSVNTSALRGAIGTLLLDPDDLFIASAAVGGASPDTTTPFTATDGTNNYYVLAGTLAALAPNTTVQLLANHNIIFQASVVMSTTPAGSLTMNAANAIQMGGFDLSTVGANVSMTAGAGGISSLGTINLGAGTLTLNSPGTIGQNTGDVIAGATKLVKQGPGTLTLSNANTYTGTTTVSGGTLAVTVNNALGTNAGNTTVASGATLDLRNVVYGTTEGVALNGGTLAASTGTSSLAGGVTLTANSAVNVTGTQLTLSGAIGGLTFGIDKQGGGTLVLSGANGYTGTTAVSGGILRLGAANRIADTSALTVASGATFDLASFAETVGSLAGAGNVTLGGATLISGGDGTSTTFSGAASGTGGLTKNGAGTLTLSGTNTYTGATTINAGIVRATGGVAIGDASQVTLANAASAFLDLTNSEAIGNLSGGGAVGGNVTLNGNTLIVNETTATNFSGVLSGGGGVTKQGAAVLTLLGANTYTGATTVSVGTLRLGAANRIADTSALTVASGATFDLNNQAEAVGSIAGAGTIALGSAMLASGGDGTSTTFSGAATGTGGLTKNGGGVLTLSGANTYTGATTINAGTVRASGGSAIADTSQVTLLNAAGASLDLTGSERIGNLNGGGLLGGNVTLNGNTLTVNQAGTTNFAGVASGAGGLIKQGTGALTLSGTNTYSGDTTVTAGTLTLGASNVLADATHVIVNGGTMAQTTNSDTVAGVQLVAGSITGTTGTLTSTTDYDLQSGTVSSILGGTVGANKSTGGTVIVSGANTYAGATNVSAGTLAVTANNALGTNAAGTTVAAGATLDLRNVTYGTTEAMTLNGGTLATSTGTSSFAGAVTLGANSAVNVAGTQLTLSGAIGGGAFGIDKQGVGRLVLSAVETYTGTTAVSGGSLRLGAANRIADASAVTVAAGATFDLNNFAETVGSLAGAGNVTLGSATLNAGGDGTSTTFSGIASGTGGLTKTGGGILTLSGANSYSGATAINAGTLVAANAGALGATTGATTVANTATLRIANVAVGAEAVTLNGAGVSGNGALVGTGTASLGGAVTIASNSTIAASNLGDTLSLAGTVNGPAALTQAGAGTVAFGNAVGGTTTLASFTSNAGSTTQVNGGSIRTAGTQVYNGALTTGGATTLRTTNSAITANGAVNTTAGALTLVAGTGNATFTNTANNFGTVGVTNAGAVSLVDANGLNLAASSVSTLRAQTLAGDITVSGIINATGAGDSIVLASGGNFVNTIGSTALNPGAGRWLVWSTNPLLDTRGGLANVFKQYNATYGVTPVASGGNGFLYTLAPTISVGLTGAVSKVYNGSAGAALAPSNYNVSGAVDGDTVAINNPAGTYDNRNVGTNKNVAVSGLAITSATNLGTTVYGYQLASTSANANIGTITPAALTVSATTNTKTYNGTTSATATPTVTGLVGGDTATGLTEAYADKNAGTGKTLLVSGYTVNDGNGGNNYAVSLVNNTTGVINQAALTGNITAANKTYDATNAATISSRTLSGAIGGDTVTYVGGTATFADKNAALGKTVTATGLSLTGADAGNYTVNTTATTTANIATLAITGAITAANKTYDGTNAATINSRTLSGVIGGDTVSYVGGTATFLDKNAALGKTVTATGLGLAGLDAGNYSVNTTATTTADIATLAITGAITAANKTYDGTNAATINSRTLSGVIGGDTVSYVGGTATFSDKNAGLGKTVTATGLGLAGADATNYTVNTTATTTADIAALGLTGAITAANKTYDGTIAATITDRTLSGVIAGDAVTYVGGTATFSDKNAALGKTVTATGLGLAGVDANNYTVNTTATTTADIAALAISGAITAANKTYDGTNAATINSRTLSGVIGGDTVSYVGGTATFSDKNVGSSKTVTATGLGLAGLDAGNYSVNTTATTTADIAALAITGAITAANKTYDGTNAATINSRTLSGVIGGDAVSYVGGTATFSDKNAALGKTVTATGLSLSGVDATNYTVNTTATTTADIAALGITGAITAANKTYDGTTAATITDRTLSGVIAGDTVDYVGGTATFADKNAGLGKTVTATGLSLAGIDANNYSVNTTATTTADIATLAITGAITAANKTYDGTNTATINSRTLSGVIAGDTVSYVGGTATFADKNAAPGKTVTATGLALSGVDAGNYSVNTTATTTADITALGIVGAITAANKTYDGTTAATITDRSLSGVIAGDTVDYVGGTATFADKNAALGKTVTATGLSLSGVDANNYTVNTTATTTADIAALGIVGAITAANKTYDGTTAATITGRTLSGVIAGDTVSYAGGSATFSDKNAALGKTVTATGLGLAGADANNYTVNTTATTTADIATLAITGAITAANKTYDGTTAATISDRTLSGVISGDTVDYVGGTATFADKNAGLGKTVTATGLSLAGVDANNYTVNTTAITTADIAALAITGAITTANKTYDGTTAATITDRTLSGVISGDAVTYVGGIASFSDKNAGLGKTVTATGLGLAGLDAGNYTVNTTAATTADIATLAITGAITAANKAYDGTTSATITARTLTGVISGDAVAFVGGTANFSDKNVGLGKTVTATGLGLAGVDAGNYTVNDTATTTADIAALAITGAVTAANKTYDGTTSATITDRTLTGVISGDAVTYIGGTANFSDKNAMLGKTVTATGLGLAGLDAGNYTVNTTATTTADIAALAINGAITAANKTYDGTTNATITDRTLTGVISGDAVTYVGGTANFSDKNAGLGKTVTATGLGLAGLDAGNYTVNTTATTTADIAALAITGAITAANKTYDGTTAATIVDRTLTGVIGGDTVSYVGGSATFADKNAGLGKTVTATGLSLSGIDANNYTVNTTATTTADIAALAITGAITAANKTYDGTTTATIMDRTLTGVISGDAVSYVGGTATFSDKNAGLGKTVTGTGLGLAGSDANNYTVNTTATTTADIATLAITGAITASNKTYDGTTAASVSSRTLSGVISGDAVSYVGGTATFVDKNTGVSKVVTAIGLGLAGADAGNYTVNDTATTTADIAALGITGAITAANKVYDGDTTATITNRTLTGVISGDMVSYVGGTATFADKNAGLAKTVTGVGLTLSGADAGNYTVNATALTAADITQRPLTVTADIGQTKVYGDADPLPYAYTITSGNLVTGDSLSGVLSRNAGENVGGYAITQNTLTAGSNYNLAFLSNPFAITPATLTYVATPVEIFQGVPFPPFTGTVQGLKGSDTLASATTGTLAFTTTAPNSNLPGTFPIDGSGLSANFGNYVFVQDPANGTALTIEQAGFPTLPGAPGDAFVGALASAGQSESACAELRDTDGQETLCGVQLNYRQTERVNLVPGFRRIIDSAKHTFALDGAGIRLPAGVGQ